jgi:hypothetical protein
MRPLVESSPLGYIDRLACFCLRGCVAVDNLKGKEKKQHEAKRIELLGGKAAKNRSTPYHILSAIKKARVVRDARKEVLVRQYAVFFFYGIVLQDLTRFAPMLHRISRRM